MNVSQALEYERQPFIPMFIYGDHGAMESERQKGEEALKVLETEYFTAEGDPGFDFATVRDLADRNRDLCDQIGEARLRNVTPATLSRGLSDADTCAAIGKMQKRTAASVMREIRGDRDALGVAYARKPIQGTVLGIDPLVGIILLIISTSILCPILLKLSFRPHRADTVRPEPSAAKQ